MGESLPSFEYKDDLEKRIHDIYFTSNPDLANRIRKIVVTGNQWRLRRVESVTFSEPTMCTRQISIDFLVPPLDEAIYYASLGNGGAASNSEDQLVLPLATLKKAVLNSFDIRDESGASLPILLAEENAVLSTLFLINLFQVLNDDLTFIELIRPCLSVITGAEADSASLEPFLCSLSASDDVFARYYVDLLASSFILFVVVSTSQLPRRIVKFTYVDVFGDAPRRGYSTADRVRRKARDVANTGVASYKVDFDALGSAKSFHAQLCIPLSTVFIRQWGNIPEKLVEGEYCLGPTLQSPNRLYLYCRNLAVSRSIAISCDVSFVSFSGPSFSAFFGIMTLFIGCAALVLSLKVSGSRHFESIAGSSLPILLIVPAGLSLFLDRDGETHVVTRLLRTFRTLGLGSALYLVVLAAAVALLPYVVVVVLSAVGLVTSTGGIIVMLRWFFRRNVPSRIETGN